MCLACGFPTASGDWSEAGVPAGAEGARERARMLAVIVNVLACWDLKAQFIPLTGGFKIATSSGRHSYARTLDELWPAAAQLAGRPVDPLDPSFTRAFGGLVD